MTCNYRPVNQSHHCLIRQQERGIPDNLLQIIIWRIPSINPNRTVYIVSIKTLKECGIDSKRSMAIVMRGRDIITVYYIDDLRLFFFNMSYRGHDKADYKII